MHAYIGIANNEIIAIFQFSTLDLNTITNIYTALREK